MSPGQLTKVNYSLFCKCILLSNKYFSWFYINTVSFYLVSSYWSGYILVTFGANLNIIHIEATNVINGVQLF